jgi:glycerol-3-phosphate dehydrogenase (NAD(P)+)
MSDSLPITVVGAGAWGTALSALLAQKGHKVTIWSYEPEIAESINQRHLNPYLSDVSLPEGLRAETDLAQAVRGANVVLSASPSQFVRSVMSEAARNLADGALIVSASKGIELGSLLCMDQVLDGVLPEAHMRRFCALSGPSFAREVAAGSPTAVVVAGRTEEAAEQAQRIFQTPYFRVYTNTDVAGVELGGALKNVMALAAGITTGLGYGHNTMAALITRGLAEMMRLGVAMGAEAATFSGLAGMGDLVLTCTGALSRNRTVGFRLGQGESLDEILADMTAVAEGVKTAAAVHELAGLHGVEMPIVEQVYQIMNEDKNPADALKILMLRDPKPEDWK